MVDHRAERRGTVRPRALVALLLLVAVIAVAVAWTLMRPGPMSPAGAAPGVPQAAPVALQPEVTPDPATPPGPAAAQPAPPAEELELNPPFDVLDPVDLDEEAVFDDGVTARLVELLRTEVKAKGPGETAGAGALVTVEIENTTDEPISLQGVVVDFYDETEAPVVVNYSDPRTSGFSRKLKPGKVARATYVARLADQTDSLSITVSYEPGAPAVSFSGKL